MDFAQIVEMAQREIRESYKDPGERSAYRAGMSTAAAICDALAKHAAESNTTRGKITQAGKALHAMAKACGDAIWNVRKEISEAAGRGRP